MIADDKIMGLANSLLYKLVTALFDLMGRLPATVSETLAVRLGSLLYRLDLRHRRMAEANLTRAFGQEMSPQRIQIVARKVFINLFRIFFEVSWSRRLPESHFSRHFRTSGFDSYLTAQARGRGVLLLCAHFGNWELLPIIGHLHHLPVQIVYRPLDAPFLDRFFKENRCRFGANVIAKHRGAMRQIYRALKEGKPVAMLLDQNVDWYEGVFVDFFNHRACTSSGMASLAVRTRAPVVPVFLLRTPDGFHTVFGPELTAIETGDHTKDIEINTAQYNRIIEAYARKFPDQWFWVHNRWKTRPYQPWPRVPKQHRKRNRK